MNFRLLHICHVKKFEVPFNMCTIYGILLHFKLFCCKICVFWRFTLFCRKIGLLRFTCFCVKKILAKNSVRGEKMTNMRYAENPYYLLLGNWYFSNMTSFIFMRPPIFPYSMSYQATCPNWRQIWVFCSFLFK